MTEDAAPPPGASGCHDKQMAIVGALAADTSGEVMNAAVRGCSWAPGWVV